MSAAAGPYNADEASRSEEAVESSVEGAFNSEAAINSNICLKPGYWVAWTRSGDALACEKDIEAAIAAAEEAGFSRDEFALSQHTEDESEFGGVEIEVDADT